MNELDDLVDMAHTIFLRMAVRGGFDSYTGARLHEWLRRYESLPTMRAPDVANVTATSVSCPRCGLTWSEFPEDFCVCDPNTTPYAVGMNKCYRCGKPRG